MHIKATDELGKRIKCVRVDNKIVTMPVELDTEEGWVDCLEPIVQDVRHLEKNSARDDGEGQLKVRRLLGVVTVEFLEEAPE